MRDKTYLLDEVLFMTGYRCDLDERFPEHQLRVLDKPFRYRQFAELLTAMTV